MLMLAAVVPVLMIGLRYRVGADWYPYAEIFEIIGDRPIRSTLFNYDPAYVLLNKLAHALGTDIWLVNLSCGLIFMFGVIRFSKAQPLPWLAVAIAVPYLIIVVGMGYSRQAVAIGLVMAGLAAISEGAVVRFVLWVLVASLFHRTAIVVLPIVVIAYSRNRLQAVLFGIVGAGIGYFLLAQGEALEHFSRVYVRRVYESQGAIFRLSMNLPPALLYMLYSRRVTTNDTERATWRTFAVLALLSWLAWFFVNATTALDRLGLYILPLQIFVLSRLPSTLSTPGRVSGILVGAVLAYSAVVLFVWLNFSNHAYAWVPYRFYPFN